MPQPNLGYGKQSEATIDQVNIAMRAWPEYQTLMRSWGQDPGHPTLSKSQSQQVLKLAQGKGVVVDEGSMEVDNHGNFNPVGHKLRNTLIVAGVAAATIATMGAAGVFSGAAAAGGAAAGGGGAAAATGAGSLGALAGGGAAAATGGGLAATLTSVPVIASGIGTLGSVFTNIYSANKQANASRDALAAQTEASRYATDAQTAATDKTLAFTREQAQNQWRNDELTRHANYDQYSYRANGARTLGDLIGFHLPDLPGYVASEDPRFTNGGSTAPGAAPAKSTALLGQDVPSDGDWIGASLAAAKSTDDPSYWAKEIAKDPKVAAGDQSAIAYWKDRIARGDGAAAVKAGTVQRYGAAAQPARTYASLGAMAQPLELLDSAPGYTPFTPGSFAALVRG